MFATIVDIIDYVVNYIHATMLGASRTRVVSIVL